MWLLDDNVFSRLRNHLDLCRNHNHCHQYNIQFGLVLMSEETTLLTANYHSDHHVVYLGAIINTFLLGTFQTNNNHKAASCIVNIFLKINSNLFPCNIRWNFDFFMIMVGPNCIHIIQTIHVF